MTDAGGTKNESAEPRDRNVFPARDRHLAELNITAIVCTYNRCESLAATLESLAASHLPDSLTWEALVVDNNSTDETRAVVEDFCRRYPTIFRYQFEPTSGKSYALNTGIKHARGEVLAFVDDDATVEPTWLANIATSLFQSDWSGTGGRTLPAEKFVPPSWLPGELSGWGGIAGGCFDLGDQPCELNAAPYGTNMAFRKSVFEKYGGFRTDLGPSPNPDIPHPNEDTELGRRVMAAGGRLRYEPSAVVYHPVRPERITKKYFFSWWFDYGRAVVRERGKRPATLGIRRDYLSLLRCAVEILMMILRWIIAVNARKRFLTLCWASRAAGQIVEICHRSRIPNWGQMTKVIAGTAFCAGAAMLTWQLASGLPSRESIPLLFIPVIVLTAAVCGRLTAILGCFASGSVFAYVLPPSDSLAVSDPAARANLAWMLLLAIALSYLVLRFRKTKPIGRIEHNSGKIPSLSQPKQKPHSV